MNEYESARRSGNATRTETTASSTYEPALRSGRGRRCRWMATAEAARDEALTGLAPLVRLARASGRLRSASRPRSLVMNQPLDETELNEREDEHQREEHDRLRAGEAELEVLERIEVDAVDERPGRVHGTASRQKVDLREGLQHRDGVDDQEEEQRRRHHRDRDAGEHPDAASPVEARRLVDLLGDSLKTGEQDDDVRTERDPDRRDGDGDDRDRGLDEPLRPADADEREDVVKETEAGIEEQKPHERPDRRRYRDRAGHHGPKDVDPAQALIQQDGEHESERDPDRNGVESEECGRDQSVAERRRRDEVEVVIDPVEGADLSRDPSVEKRKVERPPERDEDEHREQDQRRREIRETDSERSEVARGPSHHVAASYSDVRADAVGHVHPRAEDPRGGAREDLRGLRQHV